MRKILISFGIFSALAIAATVFYLASMKQPAGFVDDNSAQPELIFDGGGSSAGTPTSAKPDSETPTLPEYKGQALDFLGDSKILAGYPKEFVDTKRAQLANVIGLIKQDPGVSVNWMDLGLIKKNFDNFVGTRDAWEYVKLLNPENALAYYNLGKLYSAYLHDNQKAETNFLEAVRRDQTSDYPYLGLAEFYRDFYKEKSDQVDDVLLAGLKNLPADPNLIIQLAFYYKAAGDKANAIKYFEQFLKLPVLTGEQQKAIEAELTALKG